MRKLISALSLLLVCGMLEAQLPQSRENCTGIFTPYDFDGAPAPTRAPKGFKPFHISTYARHGSRNYSNSGTFETIYRILQKEDSLDNLTAQGREFFERYACLLPVIKNCGGDLTGLGMYQHRTHAERMHSHYRNVFRKRHGIYARSTQTQRTMMSMMSFCNRMSQLDRKADVHMSASGHDQWILSPNTEGNPRCEPRDLSHSLEKGPWFENYMPLCREKMHPDEFFSALFRNPATVEGIHMEAYGKGQLPDEAYYAERNFYYVVCTAAGLDPLYDTGMPGLETDLSEFVSLREMQGNWECENYRMYNVCGANPWFSGRNIAIVEALLRDFIFMADNDIKDDAVAARVRYGHDYKIAMMLALLQVDGWDRTEADPQKVKFAYQVHKIAMGSTLQWVFYRNRKGEILVKVMLNERDLHFPIINYFEEPAGESQSSPFYRWEDFRAYCCERIAWAINVLDTK